MTLGARKVNHFLIDQMHWGRVSAYLWVYYRRKKDGLYCGGIKLVFWGEKTKGPCVFQPGVSLDDSTLTLSRFGKKRTDNRRLGMSFTLVVSRSGDCIKGEEGFCLPDIYSHSMVAGGLEETS
jgi:hypothetical protein